jgi:FMN reductase
MTATPRIVGLGGTSRPDSTSERALRACLARLDALGAHTEAFCSDSLDLPLYGTVPAPPAAARRLVEALRQCDGVIVSSPCYHGGMSGAIKNALDYVEELRDDARPYLDGRAVGIVVCAYGVQAIGTTLAGMRSTVHALRGWPTPMAAGVNASGQVFAGDGLCIDPAVQGQLDLVAEQVWEFATMRLCFREKARSRAAA